MMTVAAVVVALDAITKLLALHFLAGRGVVHVGGVFELDLYRNHAGARNSFMGRPVLVSLLAIAAVIVIAAVAARVQTRAAAVAAGLLLGGGIGNLADRIFGAPGPLRGGVIDWLRPPWSSGSMNLADLSITAAVIVAVVALVLSWRAERRRALLQLR
jgi:signal peptidase II